MIDTDRSTLEFEHVACNLCGSTETTIRFPDTLTASLDGSEWHAFRCTHPGYGVHPPIVTCQRCGYVYANPRIKVGTIRENYEMVEDPLYLQERPAREVTFRHHLKHLERYTGPAAGRRLLDVGAYIGVFVEVACEAGWDAWGVEPSAWGVKVAQERGLNMVQGVLEEADIPSESFDALTMWDVIEHLADPTAGLRESYRILKPGGWIAAHTMDIDSLFARLMGARWPWLMEMHIHFFSRRTLAEMLTKVGFEVASVKPEGRFLNVGYLTTRLRAYSPPIAGAVGAVARLTGLDRMPVPVNFGDLVTAYARKPTD
jgi:2-polyprenyl-3-methyl-5-hydroxy-6-metoxy-1,4-benzoquinol methylase